MWYLVIYKPGAKKLSEAPLGDVATVSKAIDQVFKRLKWATPNRAVAVKERYAFELVVGAEKVQRIGVSTEDMDLRNLAALCKSHGWHLRDPDTDDEADVDLDDIEGWYQDHHG